jgi:hypothetical protein
VIKSLAYASFVVCGGNAIQSDDVIIHKFRSQEVGLHFCSVGGHDHAMVFSRCLPVSVLASHFLSL